MRQDDTGIRIDLQQGFQGQQVTGRLSTHFWPGQRHANVAESDGEIVYGPLSCGRGQPGRKAHIHGFEGVAAKVVAVMAIHSWAAGRQSVHRLEIRHQEVEPLQFSWPLGMRPSVA